MPTKEKINLLLVLGAILVLLMIGVSKESFPYQITKKNTEPKKKSKPVEVYEPELLTPMFYLVAGSFTNEENAELFATY